MVNNFLDAFCIFSFFDIIKKSIFVNFRIYFIRCWPNSKSKIPKPEQSLFVYTLKKGKLLNETFVLLISKVSFLSFKFSLKTQIFPLNNNFGQELPILVKTMKNIDFGTFDLNWVLFSLSIHIGYVSRELFKNESRNMWKKNALKFLFDYYFLFFGV